MEKITLGFEIGTGKEVKIQPAHLIVCGITQLSGKTTTLEALIHRSGLKAVVFKTKVGEKSFTEGTEIPPFFRDRSDYEFVKSLLEAYSKEKLFIEKGTLMRLTKQASGQGLIALKKLVDEEIAIGKLRGINLEIYTRLQHYLENVIPQIQYSNLSKTLMIQGGINIMNLERFSPEAQSLIIEATASEVLNTMNGVIVVIPEAWKFLPQKYNNPCKRSVEEFIRQGATNNNFVWIDSQDMAGVDKGPLKQVSTWILGYQAERNEVKHTLDQMSLPRKSKPKEDEIMTLKIGQFFISTSDGVIKVYVMPAWLDEETAKKVAKGKMDVLDVKKPQSLVPYSKQIQTTDTESMSTKLNKEEIMLDVKKEIIQIRQDFFNKINEVQSYQQKLGEEIYKTNERIQPVNIDEIVSKVLQKMPVQQAQSAPFDREKLIQEIVARVPSGGATYMVSPLEKIKKNFLEEAKNRILSLITPLDDEQKKMLKYIEAQGTGQKLGTIIEKCLFKSQTSGGTRESVTKKLKDMDAMELIRWDGTHSVYYPTLKDTIKKYCDQHGATDQDINQVYSHILSEMI